MRGIKYDINVKFVGWKEMCFHFHKPILSATLQWLKPPSTKFTKSNFSECWLMQLILWPLYTAVARQCTCAVSGQTQRVEEERIQFLWRRRTKLPGCRLRVMQQQKAKCETQQKFPPSCDCRDPAAPCWENFLRFVICILFGGRHKNYHSPGHGPLLAWSMLCVQWSP